MNILDVSINSLIESAPNWHTIERLNSEEFCARNGELVMIFNGASRNMTIKQDGMAVEVTFKRIPEDEFDKFLSKLRFVLEED